MWILQFDGLLYEHLDVRGRILLQQLKVVRIVASEQLVAHTHQHRTAHVQQEIEAVCVREQRIPQP